MTRLKHLAATRRLILEITWGLVDLLLPAMIVFWPHSVLTTSTFIASVAVKWTLPIQMYLIWKSRSAQDLSIIREESNAWSYALWAGYGYIIHNPVIFWAQLPGFIGSYAVTRLVVHYKSTRLMPRYTADGHTIGGLPCKRCADFLAEIVGARKLPFPLKCFACDEANIEGWHLLSSEVSEGRITDDLIEKILVQAQCAGCRRVFRLDVGPAANPAWWNDLVFRIIRHPDPTHKEEFVDQAEYVSLEVLSNTERAATHQLGDWIFRWGAPCSDAFQSSEGPMGSILTKDGEPLELHLAREIGAKRRAQEGRMAEGPQD